MKRILISILMRIMPSCKKASLLQAKREVSSLSLRERAGLLLHLAVCKYCRWYAKQMQLLKATCRNPLDHPPMPASARERIAARLSEELDN